ncbi:MAG TPA: lamin tail domain-containing protein, partial [Flavobacteriales bacterium]|nr:lamin tail domain-containing protein [Flavobacteriales bacterium]
NRTTAFVSATQLDATITAGDIASVATIPVTVLTTGAAAESNAQNFSITATPTPTLFVTDAGAFGAQCIGGTYGPVTITVDGTDLTANATVGPATGYSFSLTSGGIYNSTVSVPQSGGSIVSETVYVKFSPVAVTSYNGPIPVSSTGATTVNSAVSGSGVNTAPAVTTGGATSIVVDGAVLAGTISNTGCSAISAYGIEYSLTNGFANGAGTQLPASNLSGGNFSSTLSGQSPCTTIYFKAYATNGGGTTYGSQGSFTTASVSAPVAIAASSVNANNFTANWNTVSGATSYRLDVSTSPTFGTTTNATDLFISEYMEGSSNNKYIEVYNGTGASVNLTDYRLRLYANGAGTPTQDVALTGTLANGATVVYRNASATLYGGTASPNNAVNYNGDDAMVLFKISTASNVDIVGRIGEDPGTEWTAAGGYSTLDKTLVRKASVSSGVTVNPGAGFPTLSTEWDVFAIDDVSHLGAHTFNAFTPSFVTGYNDLTVAGTSQLVSGLAASTTYYYRVRAVGGSCTSANSNVINVTTGVACTPVTITGTSGAGTYCSGSTINLGVTVSGTAPFLYEWTGAGTITNDDQANASVTASASGNYHITVVNDCGSDEDDVAVVVNTAPNAGTNGSTTTCSNASAFDMATFLGTHDNGGAWTFGGNPHSNTFTPGTDAAGIYTYTVTGTAPCANASATVTIGVNTAPNAGTNGVLTVC